MGPVPTCIFAFKGSGIEMHFLNVELLQALSSTFSEQACHAKNMSINDKYIHLAYISIEKPWKFRQRGEQKCRLNCKVNHRIYLEHKNTLP